MRTAKSPSELGLNHNDRRRLGKALRDVTDARDFRRLQAVLLVAQGRSIAEVAQVTFVSPRSIYGWLERYLELHRVEDLLERPRSGRPSAAEVITDECILRELAKDPTTLGYSTETWTVRVLANHLSRTYDCPITECTLRRRLHSAGLSWKRPRYSFSKKDPHCAQEKGLSCGV